MGTEDRFAFSVEWLDPMSGVTWKYNLLHQPSSMEIEMFDVKARRTFLKKTRYESLPTEQLRPGNTVVVYGRQLKVLDYADAFTRRQLEWQQQRTCVVIKPFAVDLLGDILSALHEAGFLLQGVQMCLLTSTFAQQLWQHDVPSHELGDLVSELIAGPVVALDLVAEDAFRRWEAFQQHLSGGKINLGDACVGSTGPAVAGHQLSQLFTPSGQVQLSFQGTGTTLCVIKPHAVAQGFAGPILTTLGQHFRVTGVRSATLELAEASSFLEVYREVLPGGELSAMIKELIAGPCLAIELASQDSASQDGTSSSGYYSTVEALRSLCGPHDPQMARDLRPHTLRALYGRDKAQNAVHCTDLEEDAPLETGFFFTIMH
ncbi:hypothetical protein WJX73_010291 [Symbiochloris irregularis]|uniref:DM10 domain-containing protein n=1 Tax=Symbiochloris irregularis TaxID=706552 RepID=A0AAW1PSK1_9CHLO